MTPLRLAWANLVHKRGRTFIAAAGVSFAVVLVFMELGMLGGVGRTATMLYDKLQFDLLITSSEYLDLSRPGEVPRERLAQAQAADGVAGVQPLSFGLAAWRAPARESLFGEPIPAGELMSINIVAAPPDQLDKVFVTGEGGVFASADAARAAGDRLRAGDAFLLDRQSKPEFGDIDRLMRTLPAGGDDLVRVNQQRARIVGGFRLGTGFSWNGMLMASEGTYERFTLHPANEVNFGLVTLDARFRPGGGAGRACGPCCRRT